MVPFPETQTRSELYFEGGAYFVAEKLGLEITGLQDFVCDNLTNDEDDEDE